MSLAGWFRAALWLLEDRSPVAKYPPDERARAIEFHASLPMALHILCKIYACLRRFGQAALMEESDRGLRTLHDRRSPGKQPGQSVFSAAKKMLAGEGGVVPGSAQHIAQGEKKPLGGSPSGLADAPSVDRLGGVSAQEVLASRNIPVCGWQLMYSSHCVAPSETDTS